MMTAVRKITVKWISLLLVLGVWTVTSAMAEPSEPAKKRQKNLEFDEGLVEGVNKRPLDFSSKATGWKGKKKQHLYRKEISFEKDLDETVREMRYAQ